MEPVSPLESEAVFQTLRATGLLTVDLRVIRLLSRRCRSLYDTYMIPVIERHVSMFPDRGLYHYTFLQIIGKKPPLQDVRDKIISLIRLPLGLACRENPHFREIIPLSSVLEMRDNRGTVHVDNLVRLYGLESLTLEVLSQNLWFECPELVHTYVPRMIQIAAYKRVLAEMLITSMDGPTTKSMGLAGTVRGWLEKHWGPEITQEVYWKAIRSHLWRNGYGEILNIDVTNLGVLFSGIPEAWTLPRSMWREYGWLVVALDSLCGGPLLRNLETSGEFGDFGFIPRVVPVTQHLYNLIPHQFQEYFDIHGKHPAVDPDRLGRYMTGAYNRAREDGFGDFRT